MLTHQKVEDPDKSGSICAESNLTIRIDLGDQGFFDAIRIFNRDLAGTCGSVSTPTIFEHQFTDIGSRAAIENRFSGGEHDVLFLESHIYE